MCRNCILSSLFTINLYLNLYTDTKLPFTIVLLTKTDETNDASGIASLISFKSWLLFCGLVHQARIISRVSPALISSSSLNRSIILPFSELMEQEPRHHLVLNCLHSTFAVEQLLIHFPCVSRRNLTLRTVRSLFL